MEQLINNYLLFKQNEKTLSRYDLISSSAQYLPIEASANKKGEVFIYFNKTEFIKSVKSKGDYCLTKRNSEWLSSLTFPDISEPHLAYGDVFKTNDLMIVFKTNQHIEIYICKDRLQFRDMIIQMLISGQLDEQLESFKNMIEIKSDFSEQSAQKENLFNK